MAHNSRYAIQPLNAHCLPIMHQSWNTRLTLALMTLLPSRVKKNFDIININNYIMYQKLINAMGEKNFRSDQNEGDQDLLG